jgi:hypothetical protein
MKFLSEEPLNALLPARSSIFPSPAPTQIVGEDECPADAADRQPA